MVSIIWRNQGCAVVNELLYQDQDLVFAHKRCRSDKTLKAPCFSKTTHSSFQTLTMKTLRLISALAILPLVQGDQALHPNVHPPSSLLTHLQRPSRPTSMEIRTPYLKRIIMGWLHSIGIKYVPPIPPIRAPTCRDCRGSAPPQVSFKSLVSV